MRVLILSALPALAPPAAAPLDPRVAIEDDGIGGIASMWTALRAAQMEAAADARPRPDALSSNTHKVRVRHLTSQPGPDAEKLKAEIEARINSFKTSPGFFACPGAFLDKLASECASFEIRSAG